MRVLLLRLCPERWVVHGLVPSFFESHRFGDAVGNGLIADIPAQQATSFRPSLAGIYSEFVIEANPEDVVGNMRAEIGDGQTKRPCGDSTEVNVNIFDLAGPIGP